MKTIKRTIVIVLILLMAPFYFSIGQISIVIDSIKQELITEVETYINSNYKGSGIYSNILVETCLDNDFDICFAIAQAHIESHLGKYGKAKSTNNPWNVGSYDYYTEKDMKNRGFGYSNQNESILPYIKLIRDRYQYDSKGVRGLLQNFVDKYGKRYASNPNYEIELKDRYNKILVGSDIHKLQSIIQQKKSQDCRANL